MSNYIFLHGLQLKTKIGVPDFERENFQTLFIDIDIQLNKNSSFADDDIEHTVDYAEIEKLILSIGNNHNYKLLESLGEEIIATIKENFSIKSIELKIAKNKILPSTDFVGIIFKR
jgi:dihydroneopterin aldolase